MNSLLLPIIEKMHEFFYSMGNIKSIITAVLIAINNNAFEICVVTYDAVFRNGIDLIDFESEMC